MPRAPLPDVTPYYADNLVTLYHGDCRDWMPKADVIVTDPPYGTARYATDTDVLEFVAGLVASHPQLAVFGWPENLVRMCLAAARSPDEWITWWPTNAAVKSAPTKTIAREAECIAVFGIIRPVRIPRTAVLHDWHGPKSRGSSNGDPLTRYAGDVWTDSAPGLGIHGKHRKHPNQKPVSLMERLLRLVADGDVVDPFAGSGSTLIAAKQLGRKAIGIEIDERYCEAAATRLSEPTLGLVA